MQEKKLFTFRVSVFVVLMFVVVVVVAIVTIAVVVGGGGATDEHKGPHPLEAD